MFAIHISTFCHKCHLADLYHLVGSRAGGAEASCPPQGDRDSLQQVNF